MHRRVQNPRSPRQQGILIAGLCAALLAFTGTACLAQESAELRFDWPQASARVTMTSSMSQQVMGMNNTVESTSSYRMTVESTSDGMLVSYSDFVFDGTALDELMGGSAGGAEEMSQAMGNIQPDILVSRQGEYLGMANFEEVQAAMKEMMAPMLAEMEAQGMGGMFDEMMASSLSEDTWNATAAMGWKQMVGFWAGRTMRAGAPVSVTEEMPIPLVSNQTAPVEVTLEYAGRTSCTEGGSGEDCVRLVATAVPDGEAVRELMDIFMADMMAAAGGTGVEVGITALELTTVTTIIADPTTLVPYRVDTSNESLVTMDMMGMQQSTQNDQTTTVVFEWEN